MGDWTELVLGNSLELLVDNRGRNPEFSSTGIPLLSGQSIKEGGIDLAAVRFVSEETYKSWMPRQVHRGDLIVTSEAPLGRPALIRTDQRLALGQRIFGLRGADGVLDTRFLYYAFRTDAVQRDLASRATGTTVIGIRNPELRKVRIPAPSFLEQQAIAEVLGALDDKIATNERVVRLSDELSRAHFPAAAASGDEVPLSSLARFVNGRAYTKDATGTGRVVVRIAELNSGIGGSTVWNDIDAPDDNTARPGDLLFAWSGSLTAARWYRPEAIVNQHIFKVIPNAGTPMWLVNQAVREKLDEFKAIAADKATTMGHIQRHHLDEPVRIPSPFETKRLDELMTSLWQAALAAEVENLKLAETRDELLPLLMSGKVRVKDAEKTVAEAL